MNSQLLLVIVCVAVAVLFMGRRFLRSLRSRGCDGCGKAKCCDPDACPQGESPTELRPRR